MSDDNRQSSPFSFGGDHEPSRPGRGSSGSRPWVLVLVVLGLVVAAAAAYYHFHPDAVRQALSGTALELPSTQTHAYKWKDAKGTWQLTESPPPEGTPYETISVRSDTNILPMAPAQKR